MRIALFGGTFDPIHCGHLSAARAARDLLSLDRVHFVCAGAPPHRRRERISRYEHRYAMVTLACAGERAFVPSLAEAPSGDGVHYSIQTVRRFGRQLGKDDEMFFLIGADAFLELPTWYQWRALLHATNFIIVSRPGFDTKSVERVFPPGELKDVRDAGGARPVREFRLSRTAAYLLADVLEPVSATDIRRRARWGGGLDGLVPAAVAEYVCKEKLYA